jgi:hypothetical protein
MATSKEVREEIRAGIGDDDPSDEKFSDHQLNIFIRAALKRLRTRVSMTITITNGIFDTDPDDSQADLISLQAQCLINQRDFKKSADKGVRVRQDQSEIDTIGGLNAVGTSAAGEYSACAMLEQAIQDYIKNNPTLKIDSVASLYGKNIWAGTRKLWQDVDFDGQGSDTLWGSQRGDRRSSRRRNRIDKDDRFSSGNE